MTAAAAVSERPEPGGAMARSLSARRGMLTLAVLGAIVLGLLAKAPELLLPIGPDQGTYSYVAERILEGGLPYVDAWDNKPPATYYAHAAVLALVPPGVRWSASCIPGANQPCGYVALQLTDLIWTAATALALVAVARALRFEPRAIFASALLFVGFVDLSQLSKEGSTPEKQLLLPMALAYLFVLRRRWALAGLCAGVAFVFKQTAISIPVALALWYVWDRRRLALNDVARFGIGYTVPLVVTVAYFASRGGLGALWEATFAYNVNQAGTSALRIPYGLLAGAWHVFSNSSALLWLLGVGGVLVVLGRQRDRRVLVCWAVADAASLCLGGSKFAQVYFVQLVPSLALLGGLALALGWSALAPTPLGRAYAALVLACVLVLSNQFQMGVALRAWNERTPPHASTPPEQLLGQRFARERGGGPLFIWGDNSEMYLFAGARAPGRFFQTFALSHVYAERGYLERRAELMRSFQANPPAVIAVDPATARDDPDGALGLNVSSFPELRALLERQYTPIEGVGSGWQAYRLKV